MPKTTIRAGVFETNSSSVHAICFVTDEEKRLIDDGKAVIAGVPSYVGRPSSNTPEVVPTEEALEYLRQHADFDDWSDYQLLSMGYCYWAGEYDEWSVGEAEFAEVPGSGGKMYAASVIVENS